MKIENINEGQLLNDVESFHGEIRKGIARSFYQFFDDFVDQGITEAESPYILNAGSDDLAVDPAINAQLGGVVRLTAGDGDGAIAVDGSQLAVAAPVQADQGNLAFECRLKITDVSECSVYVGLTDSTSLEEPFSVSGTTVTSTATDGVGFVFDPAMTTDEWWMVGVDGDTDATGNGTTSEAPEDATYQTLRCEVDADGEGATFYIDGVEVGKLTASVCDADTDLFFTVVANGTGSNSAAATVDVDYILVEHDR